MIEAFIFRTAGPADFYSYDGESKFTRSGLNWELRLLTSGTLKFRSTVSADLFAVGGGGAGGLYGGGGSGYTTTVKAQSLPNTSLTVTIGDGGAAVAANGNPNSYHVNVREHIDAFQKLKFEAQFQRLSPGGAISYVEVPNMQNNIPAVITILQFIYDNIMYAELNTKSDFCQVCGFDGEIKIVEDNGKLIWECPMCGNRDQHKLNVARRTCGYIGTQFWNQGRTAEIRDRVMHL